MCVRRRHYLSKIFQPFTVISKTANISRHDITSRSQRLMLELGIIQQANPGSFHFLPLGLKSLNKLMKIVDNEMFKIGGQKIMFPSLINCKLWKSSGRLENAGPELFQLKDRHDHNYILSPTHEEAASDLLSSIAPLSYKQFPVLLYQISSKFRDEIKPRFGLMRGREFLMKDMYSFDIDTESAKRTYEKVGHTFFLGDKYSRPLKANFLSKNAKPEVLQMGCYGLGLSRIVAASIEVLSLEQEMRWPDVLVPYDVIILPPKAGSKEESKAKNIAEKLYADLEEQIPDLRDNILLDDRLSLTIGRRHIDARRVGYRYIIVINQKTSENVPLYELTDTKTDVQHYLSKNELFKYIKENTVF
ncbi:hypothetical protein NQ314_009677 [Rhamnusium bicolor]|uniref:proline--tRNA ligase n=1 Tax=Rhamnusium bicolor TaxID=1586634 RepID=A0AAV8XYX8_9CUCU|nr:hypothetical protein NQ314_009677 [Rhamnusium bicolor]